MLSDDCVDRPERIGFPFDAVLPACAARKWGGKTNVGRCLGSWENYVYELQVNDTETILRLTDSRHRSLSQVTAELQWIEYLYNCGLPVPKPIISLESVWAHIAQDTERTFVACVFTKCKGIQPTPLQCRAMGSQSGQIPDQDKYKGLFRVTREEIREILKNDAVQVPEVTSLNGQAGPGGGGSGTGGGTGDEFGPGSGGGGGGGAGGGAGNCPPENPSTPQLGFILLAAAMIIATAWIAYRLGRKNGAKAAALVSH